MSGAELELRPLADAERQDVRELLVRRWGSPEIVSRGHVHDASRAPALVALRDGQLVGLLTYRISGEECEVLTLDAFARGEGIGSSLLSAAIGQARDHGCRRLWLVTTNDNEDAIRFYERCGLRLVAVHRGAVEESRRLKPSIPERGENGVPISDELEFELVL